MNADELVWDGVRVGDATATVNAVAGRAKVRFEAPELRASGDRDRGLARVPRHARAWRKRRWRRSSRCSAATRPLSGEVTATVDVGAFLEPSRRSR